MESPSLTTPFSKSNSPHEDPNYKRSSSGSNENVADASTEPVVLYVSGLARDVDDQALLELFSKYGKVQRNEVVRDPHMRESRGFGFVTLSRPEDADSAIQALHSIDFHGRVLSVERAKRVRPRSPTPGKYCGPDRERRRRESSRYHYSGGEGSRHQGDGGRYSRRERSPRRGGSGGPMDRYEPQRGGYEPYGPPTRAYSNYPPPPPPQGGYYPRPPPGTQPGYYGAAGGSYLPGYPSNAPPPPSQDAYGYGKYPPVHAYPPPPPTGSSGGYPPASALPPSTGAPRARSPPPPRY